MNTNTIDILNQTLIDAINSAKAGVGNGIDFALEQIPDVCAQLLAWKFAESATYAVIGILSIIVLCSLARWAWKWKSQCTYDPAENEMFMKAFGSGLALGVSAIILCNAVAPRTLVCLKIKVAPKVYLLEYGAELVKGK